MSTSSPIRFAVIGTGMIARFHAQAVQASEGAKLAAAFGRNPKTLKEFGESFGIKTHASLESLLADPEIDAVTIATPTGDHASVAIPAAKAGKHIFCEKPLEVTPEKTDAIIRAASENKVLLAPIFQS
ncbi:MAG: Gfo/Idh/MocA family oxidoreductase, partial [Spirochaetia bacterium]|nr:Gfo/Idh/MocA family oxidoreductase [Spirochaetia bacterium]